MKLITNQQVAELINTGDAIAAMRQAFAGIGQGAQQARIRTSAGPVMMSSMGALLPAAGIAGYKIYTTINGKFHFVTVLFSTEDGRPLAAIESDTMTGLRTAAATAVAADHLARPDVATLAVIGTGVQAHSHVPALLEVRKFKEILIAGRSGQQQFAEQITQQTGIPARAVSIDEAAQAGDVVVTVTRSAEPLFSGDLLQAGAFVAAVGASKGNLRELDDRAIARADALVVEWKPQAQQEAGDLLLCKPGIFDWQQVWELGQIVDGSSTYQRQQNDLVIYKAIGVGVEDIALSGLVYRRACERFGW
ncbi:ornithine cyclodeaminase family protein [Collimonas sp.]|jgi:ornithine cyclodeaminase/alanine dehydrogenase-like protein (mu-crystallin family)|uniref:ornithine cyclodeaminase family protein n=1 Tax=Collimonas sp. TaxID=1963772 RepID=UPI002D1998FE|nr:ornithine cyclodeaminase family protein [Collimonas sp.]HWW06054.1 ornithine cyclodeaminase family protein [Collimonas sp.]